MTFNNRGLVKLPALHTVVLAGFGLFGFGLATLNAQSADTSGNGLLKGTFAFRHVAVQALDTNYNPTEVTATYGIITFDGLGDYRANATVVDNTANPVSQPLNVTGVYAIGSNGTGFLANPLYPNDTFDLIIGAVSQGVFTGSSTESYGEQLVLNDIFVAIPLGRNLANASFKTAYRTGVLDFAGGDSSAIKNALFELTPNGSGGFGTISLTGQASNQTATNLSQSITGATYNFIGDGSASLSVPLPSGVSFTDALFTGNKTIDVNRRTAKFHSAAVGPRAATTSSSASRRSPCQRQLSPRRASTSTPACRIQYTISGRIRTMDRSALRAIVMGMEFVTKGPTPWGQLSTLVRTTTSL